MLLRIVSSRVGPFEVFVSVAVGCVAQQGQFSSYSKVLTVPSAIITITETAVAQPVILCRSAGFASCERSFQLGFLFRTGDRGMRV